MSRGRRMFVLCLFALLATYSGLYAIRFFQINARVSLAKYVKASELPKVCLSTLELYDDSPENVGVWVTYMDFDGDGIDELITDAGDHGRGGRIHGTRSGRNGHPGNTSTSVASFATGACLSPVG